jgi:hypothetical protein
MSSIESVALDSIGKSVKLLCMKAGLTSKAEIMDCETGGENSEL